MFLAALLAATLPSPTPAHAGEIATQAIAEAEARWKDLDYDLVVTAAERALADPTATTDEKIEALRLAGSAHVVLGDKARAEQAFEAIFALRPDYDLPDDTSPRVLAVFDPARARWLVAQEERLATELGASLASFRLQVMVSPLARGGHPINVSVTLSDDGRIADSIVLAYRRAGAKHWSSLTASARPGTTTLTIPGAFTASATDYSLEYHVAARHRSGLTLRRYGTPDEPSSLPVEAGQVPREPKIYQRWPFWVAVGVVVIGGAFLIDQAIDVGPQDVNLTLGGLVVPL